MSVKDIILKIKTFLSEETDVEQVSENLTDIKTTDGLILNFDGNELTAGMEIFLVDESGKIPCPDGEYTFEDGSKIKVMDGKVEEVILPEEPIEGPSEEVETPETPEVEVEMNTELMSRIEKLEQENLSIREILTQLAESLSKKTFEDDVKMSMIIPEQEMLMVQEQNKPINKKNEQLNSILKNMYK